MLDGDGGAVALKGHNADIRIIVILKGAQCRYPHHRDPQRRRHLRRKRCRHLPRPGRLWKATSSRP